MQRVQEKKWWKRRRTHSRYAQKVKKDIRNEKIGYAEGTKKRDGV